MNQNYSIIIISLISLAFPIVFGDTETDQTYPAANNNYTNWKVPAINCSSYGYDHDGDGICDDWEVNPADSTGFTGLFINFTDPTNSNIKYQYKLACNPSATYSSDYTGNTVCPSKIKKDIYVELDWMKHHKPDPMAINDTIQSFQNALVPTFMQDTTSSSGLAVYLSQQSHAEFVSSSSVLVGKQVDTITIQLKKVGTPTGTIQVGILNQNMTVKKLFGTKDPSTLTTSYKSYTFSLPTSDLPYQIQSGDRIGIIFSGGDSSNDIGIMRDSSGTFDGTNSYRVYYTTSWANATSEDLYMILQQKSAGINLHIQYGEASGDGNMTIHVNNVRIGSSVFPTVMNYTILKQNYFGTVAERSNNDPTDCPNSSVPSGITTGQQSYNCLTAKRQVFHYGMFVNKIYNSNAAGWAEINGNDFFISLGNFQNNKGSIDEQEGELMHEIGHNLGLYHGGLQSAVPEDDNCKPNYLSVMSYTYIFRENKDVCRPLDFSNKNLTSLNEATLSDKAVGSYPYPANNPAPPSGTQSGQPSVCPQSGERPIWYSRGTSTIQGSTGDQIINDWNGNGTDSGIYKQNLNKLNLLSGCNTATDTSVLKGYNDWNNLNYTFQKFANFNSPPVPAETNGTMEIKTDHDMGGGPTTTEITSDDVIQARGESLDNLAMILSSTSNQYDNPSSAKEIYNNLLISAKIANSDNSADETYTKLQEIEKHVGTLKDPGYVVNNTQRQNILKMLETAKDMFDTARTSESPPLIASALPPSATFSSMQVVNLTASRPSIIYYTTDESNPTLSSTNGSSPLSLTVDSNSTIKFFAKDGFGNTSPTQIETYVVPEFGPLSVIILFASFAVGIAITKIRLNDVIRRS